MTLTLRSNYDVINFKLRLHKHIIPVVIPTKYNKNLQCGYREYEISTVG